MALEFVNRGSCGPLLRLEQDALGGFPAVFVTNSRAYALTPGSSSERWQNSVQKVSRRGICSRRGTCRRTSGAGHFTKGLTQGDEHGWLVLRRNEPHGPCWQDFEARSSKLGILSSFRRRQVACRSSSQQFNGAVKQAAAEGSVRPQILSHLDARWQIGTLSCILEVFGQVEKEGALEVMALCDKAPDNGEDWGLRVAKGVVTAEAVELPGVEGQSYCLTQVGAPRRQYEAAVRQRLDSSRSDWQSTAVRGRALLGFARALSDLSIQNVRSFQLLVSPPGSSSLAFDLSEKQVPGALAIQATSPGGSAVAAKLLDQLASATRALAFHAVEQACSRGSRQALQPARMENQVSIRQLSMDEVLASIDMRPVKLEEETVRDGTAGATGASWWPNQITAAQIQSRMGGKAGEAVHQAWLDEYVVTYVLRLDARLLPGVAVLKYQGGGAGRHEDAGRSNGNAGSGVGRIRAAETLDPKTLKPVGGTPVPAGSGAAGQPFANAGEVGGNAMWQVDMEGPVWEIRLTHKQLVDLATAVDLFAVHGAQTCEDCSVASPKLPLPPPKISKVAYAAQTLLLGAAAVGALLVALAVARLKFPGVASSADELLGRRPRAAQAQAAAPTRKVLMPTNEKLPAQRMQDLCKLTVIFWRDHMMNETLRGMEVHASARGAWVGADLTNLGTEPAQLENQVTASPEGFGQGGGAASRAEGIHGAGAVEVGGAREDLQGAASKPTGDWKLPGSSGDVPAGADDVAMAFGTVDELAEFKGLLRYQVVYAGEDETVVGFRPFNVLGISQWLSSPFTELLTQSGHRKGPLGRLKYIEPPAEPVVVELLVSENPLSITARPWKL